MSDSGWGEPAPQPGPYGSGGPAGGPSGGGPYGGGYGYGPPPQQARGGTNGMAIASLVLSILTLGGLGSILGIIFGVIGRRRARELGGSGAGLALAGIIIGVVTLVLAVVVISFAVSRGHVHTCTSFNGSTTCQDGFGQTITPLVPSGSHHHLG